MVLYQLKDEHGQLLGVDASNLLIANSGNDLPVRNLKVQTLVIVTA